MTKSTRPSLTDAMRQISTPPGHQQDGAGKVPKVKLTLRLDEPVHEELRHIAFEERRSIHAIILDCITKGMTEKRSRR